MKETFSINDSTFVPVKVLVGEIVWIVQEAQPPDGQGQVNLTHEGARQLAESLLLHLPSSEMQS